MTDCFPSAVSAATNPSSPKLVSGGAFHRSNRKIMNAESVEANALPALGLLVPYHLPQMSHDVNVHEMEIRRQICPGRDWLGMAHWHSSGISLEKDRRREMPSAQETAEALQTGDAVAFLTSFSWLRESVTGTTSQRSGIS